MVEGNSISVISKRKFSQCKEPACSLEISLLFALIPAWFQDIVNTGSIAYFNISLSE